MKTITTKKLKELIGHKDYRLLNVLPKEYFKAETIPHSINICIYESSFTEQVQETIPNKDTKFIVFGSDKKHKAATHAGELLESLGYKDIFVYKDGIEGLEKSRRENCWKKK